MGRNLVDEELVDGSETLISTPRKTERTLRTEYSDDDGRSYGTEQKTDDHRSYFSDRHSESRIGKPSYHSEDDQLLTPKK